MTRRRTAAQADLDLSESKEDQDAKPSKNGAAKVDLEPSRLSNAHSESKIKLSDHLLPSRLPLVDAEVYYVDKWVDETKAWKWFREMDALESCER